MGIFSGVTDAIGLTNWADQEEAMRRALEYFEGIQIPEQRAIELERLTSQGILTPEMAETILMESSAFEEIRTDPKLKEAQYGALMALQERAEEGLTASDRFELKKIRQEEMTQERGAREAITQQAAMQGRGGGGLEMMSKMQSQQDAATRQAMRDAQVAALSQQQKMDALMSAGQMGGQMREQEYSEQAELAKARDLMDQFNVANQQQTERMNVGMMNEAQLANLREKQRIADANIALRNQELMQESGMAQQDYANRLNLASARSGGQRQMADLYGQQSQAGLGMAAGIATAVAMGSGGGGGTTPTTTTAPTAASDVRVKENIEEAPIDIDQFLNEITGYKYNYKDPDKYGEGERLGVMAQDLEKSPMGEKVVEPMEDGVKGIDATKALHAVLASVGRLNDRMNRLEDEDERL